MQYKLLTDHASLQLDEPGRRNDGIAAIRHAEGTMQWILGHTTVGQQSRRQDVGYPSRAEFELKYDELGGGGGGGRHRPWCEVTVDLVVVVVVVLAVAFVWH
jgi:hypothetical protein